jgi:predicted anti-sigma-YlaC factor YlaD
MTTDCELIRSALLDAFDEQERLAKDVTDHIRACPSCTAFAQRHQALDVRLATLLRPPSLTPQFRIRVRRQVQRNVVSEWHEWLPDLMHVIACVVVVSLYVMLAPVDPHVAIVRGAIGALFAYAAMTIARTWLEDSNS